MLEYFYRRQCAIDRLRRGPAGPFLDGYAAALHEAGYSHSAAGHIISGIGSFSRWCAERSIDIGHFDEVRLREFSAVDSRKHVAPAIYLFLRYLRGDGVVAVGHHPGVPSERAPLLLAFETWMHRFRATSEATLDRYGRELGPLVRSIGSDPRQYTPVRVQRYLIDRLSRNKPNRAQRCATAVRMFLRFLIAEGHCTAEIMTVVPRIAHWRLATLPRYLDEKSINKIVASCNRQTPAGRRDRAILLLLSRLAFRASDVRKLQLGDIDWRRGRIRVCGKGRRQALMPLPQDVGDAILAYLKDGRPQSDDNHVFLRAHAPAKPLSCAMSVSTVVRRAMRRAAVESKFHGAHVLRHSAATAMLRRGATLDAVAALLRHRSIETTLIYAKVDLRMLQRVVQRWPSSEASPQ